MIKPSFPRLEIKAWLISLVLALLIIQVFFYLSPEDATQAFYDLVGVKRVTFFQGMVWTPLTYSFFHHPFQLSHITFNALGLFFLSGRVSFILGTSKCLKILALGIIFAAITHMVLDPLLRTESVPLIGISGGVLCLFAAHCTVDPYTMFWPLPVRAKNLFYAILFTTTAFILCAPSLKIPLLSLLGTKLQASPYGGVFLVGHACHLGGLLTGWIVTKWMIRLPRIKKIRS